MTDVQIDAGPETDRRVAEACGIEAHIRVIGVALYECQRYILSGTDAIRFAPSHNWNDAMLAAERFGLETINVADGPLGVCSRILSAVSPSQVSNK